MAVMAVALEGGGEAAVALGCSRRAKVALEGGGGAGVQ